MVTADDRCDDRIGTVYVYVQINKFQCTGFRIPDICVIVQWYTMVIRAIGDAKIEIGITQSNRYDLLHATVDAVIYSSFYHWLRR